MADEVAASVGASSGASVAPAAPAATLTPSTLGNAQASVEAAEAADSSAATPIGSPGPTVPAPADASLQPVATDKPSELASPDLVPKPHESHVPYERFSEVNASKKAAEESLKAFEWARQVSPEQQAIVPQALKLAQWLDSDPVAAYQWLGEQISNDAGNAAKVAGYHAAQVAKSRSQAEVEPTADAAIRMDDGTVVPVYSPEGQQRREAWLEKQLATKLEARFAPLAQAATKLQQQEERAAAHQQSQQWAGGVIAPISELPYFGEFKGALGEAIQALPATTTDSEMQAALYRAYTRLHTEKLSTLAKGQEVSTLASLQQRAVTGVTNPASASTATPVKTLGNAHAALAAAFAGEQ